MRQTKCGSCLALIAWVVWVMRVPSSAGVPLPQSGQRETNAPASPDPVLKPSLLSSEPADGFAK